MSNAPTRAQVDRERKARQQQQKSSVKEAHDAFVSNMDALSMAVKQQVVQKLNEFLQKYEPEKLAQLKALREEEEKRKKEAEALAKTRPTKTPSVPATPGRGPSYDRDRYGRDGYEYDRGRPYQPGGDKGRPAGKTEEKPTSKSGSKDKAEKKEEEKKEEEKEKEKKPKETPKPEVPPSEKPTTEAGKPGKTPSPTEQAVVNILGDMYGAARDLGQPDIQRSVEALSSTKDLLREKSAVLEKQEKLIARYADNVKQLESTLASVKNDAERKKYQETWKAFKQEPTYQQATQLVAKIDDVLRQEEPVAGALITADQGKRLANLVNNIATIKEKTATINQLIGNNNNA